MMPDTTLCPTHRLPLDVLAHHSLLSPVWLCAECHRGWVERDRARLANNPVAVMAALWARRRP
jgi:hypothetical protein